MEIISNLKEANYIIPALESIPQDFYKNNPNDNLESIRIISSSINKRYPDRLNYIGLIKAKRTINNYLVLNKSGEYVLTKTKPKDTTEYEHLSCEEYCVYTVNLPLLESKNYILMRPFGEHIVVDLVKDGEVISNDVKYLTSFNILKWLERYDGDLDSIIIKCGQREVDLLDYLYKK